MKETKNKEKSYYEHKPVREFKATISKDGKFWLLKDITTHFVPRKYLSTIESDFVIEKSKQGTKADRDPNGKVE